MKPPSVSMRSSLAVTLLCGFTLLMGAGHLILGGSMIVSGVNVLNDPSNSSEKAWGFVGQVIGGLLLIAGIPLFLEGVLELLASAGALARKRWGQILMISVALLSVAWGILWLSTTGGDAGAIAIGAAHLIYGAVVFVVIIRNNAEFDSVAAPRQTAD